MVRGGSEGGGDLLQKGPGKPEVAVYAGPEHVHDLALNLTAIVLHKDGEPAFEHLLLIGRSGDEGEKRLEAVGSLAMDWDRT